MSQQNSLNINEYTNFIWKIAELLRGDYKQSEYGDVVLPFTVLCRLDSVLLATKERVLEIDKTSSFGDKVKEKLFEQATGMKFYNKSNFTFIKLKDDAPNIAENLRDYITSFSANVQEIMEAFNIYAQIERLDKAGLLYMVISKYADEIDLSPEKVPNDLMGYIFEELIRRFSEISNETAGEHFTPREVIRLMVSLIFNEDGSELSEDGKMTSLYDPASGTGGMLAIGSDYLKSLNQTIYVDCYGQELNPMTYAVCKSDMLIKGQQYDRIYRGNSFTEDGTAGKTFSYMLCNPPFGVEWKKYDKAIKEENENLGFSGRFGAGLPRISDGSFLFLQHMISKMKPVDEGGSRIAIVFNGSPLFTGDAGSGESEIRRWIIENDWLETIVALPDQMFYNTGISTYIWIVTNRKSRLRQGKIQLINAADFSEKMRKSLGSKRNQITDTQINAIVGIHKDFLLNEYSKIFDNEDFGYWKVTVERPIRYNFSCCEDRVYSLPIVFQKKKSCTWSWSQNDLDGLPMPQDMIDLKNDLVSLGDEVYTDEKQFKVLMAPVVKKHKLTAAQQRTLLYNVLSAEDENGTIYLDAKGNQVANTSLRDYETIPLKTDIQEYFAQEVLPHVPDAWIDESKTKKGYEIPFTRQFYKYVPLRESSVILSEIKELEDKIQADIVGLFE
ncbi:MAG: N-6 DNA methylase [Hungatella sp.]|jgi:type I restriction enzyme M protein|nr:N-6 DNA methylase [Hungatella sp.]